MVVALFALSLVMILGGIASVVQGFPYVRLESGLAMVIGGATAASAGAVLLGLAAVVMRLVRVEAALGAVSSGAAPLPFELPRETGPLPSSSAPAAAGAAGLAGLTVGGTAPAFVANAPPPTTPSSDAEPTLPDLLPPDEPARVARPKVEPPPLEAPAASGPASPEEDLFAGPSPGAQRIEPPPLRASLDEPPAQDESAPPRRTPAPEPEAEAAPPAKPQADPNPVVGTYSSGDNTYVMFADGTIEADTPRGRFTFSSLDELKTFVAAGGESDTRGAA